MKHTLYRLGLICLLAVVLTDCQSSDENQKTLPAAEPTPQPLATLLPLEQLGVQEVVGEIERQIGTYYESNQQEFVLYEWNVVGEDLIAASNPLVSYMQMTDGDLRYRMMLPMQPQGNYEDVDNNGQADQGVLIFTYQLREKMAEDSPLAVDHLPGGRLAVTVDPQDTNRLLAGDLVVWAPDNQQMFPTGLGGDGVLFTADDPVQPLLPGFTAISFSVDEVVWQREPTVTVTIPRVDGIQYFDLSAETPLAAYDQVLALLDTHYPGWEATDVQDDLREEMAQAAAQGDDLSVYQVYGELVAQMQNAMVTYTPASGLLDFLQQAYPADYGFLVVTVEDGTVRVSGLRENGPADLQGMDYGDILLEVNSVPVDEAIANQPLAWFGDSNLHTVRKLQELFLLRGLAGNEMELKIRTLLGETKTLTLTAENHRKLLHTGLERIFGGRFDAVPPVTKKEFDAYGYIRVNNFDTDPVLTLRLFEEALRTMQEKEMEYLVLDLRQASGSNFLQLAGYFSDKHIDLGELDCGEQQFPVNVEPKDEQYVFEGVSVLTGNACSGSCELEVLALQELDNVTTYGVSPSAGAMNIGYQAEIKLPGQGSLAFPLCRFTQGGKAPEPVTPHVELPNTFYANYAGNMVHANRAYADLFLQTNPEMQTEAKFQPLPAYDVFDAYLKGIALNDLMSEQIFAVADYHDMDVYDLYKRVVAEDLPGSIGFPVCFDTPDEYQTNSEHYTVSYFMDGAELTSFNMYVADYENTDTYSIDEEEDACIAWMAGFEEWTAGYHLIQMKLDIEEAMVINDSYWEPGVYDFNFHLLVVNKEAGEEEK